MDGSVNGSSSAAHGLHGSGLTRKILLGLQIALLLASLALHVLALRYKLTSRDYSFQDFRCYYMAATLKWNGEDPYISMNTILPFVYAPTTLLFFRSFTYLAIRAAEWEWLAFNGAVLFLLIYFWKTCLSLPLGIRQGLLLSCGFTLAIFQNLVTGNVGLLEQLLLWGGLAALLRGRFWTFGVCIVAASQFKQLTLLFLPCLFLMDGDSALRRKQWTVLLGSLGLFAGTLLANFLVWRTWPQELAANLARIDYNGANCDPSSRAFVEDFLRTVAPSLGGTTLNGLISAAYLACAAGVLTVSARAIMKYRKQSAEYDPFVCLLFVCLVNALILPRLKLYSYVLVLPPAMFMAAKLKSWKGAVVFLLCLIPTHNFLYPFETVWRGVASVYDHLHVPGLVSNYTSWFALWGIWGWYVNRLSGPGPSSPLSLPMRVDGNEHA